MKKIIILLLTMVFLLSTTGIASATSIGNHTIEFINHTYDSSTNISTWCYEITSGTKPAISFWIIDWCNVGVIESCSEDYEYVKNETHTNITGIKFEEGYGDGETKEVCFSLRGDYYEGDHTVCIKAGQDENKCGTVIGPRGPDDCPCCPIPELNTFILLSVGLLTLVGYVSARHKK